MIQTDLQEFADRFKYFLLMREEFVVLNLNLSQLKMNSCFLSKFFFVKTSFVFKSNPSDVNSKLRNTEQGKCV